MTDGAALVACELVRRGRFLVAEPFLTPGTPLALGRRGSVAAEPGELVLVEPAPNGNRARLVERIGSPGDIGAVLYAVAAEAGVARPFGEAVERELARLPDDPPAAAGARRDLRDRLAFTVDPGTAKDHDDAISVEREGDGFRVLVHIADVAAAVASGSAIDAEAARRGFSSYLPGRVDPMLPPALSAGLCSLAPGRPRDVVTVEVPLSAALEPGPPAFYRAQIVSARRFAYEEVEELLAGHGSCPAPLRASIADAARVADGLRQRRRARGALMLAPRELELSIADGRVAGARRIAEPAAHALVEELMILANEAVAQLLQKRRGRALHRVHEPPDADAVERLYAQLAELEVPTPPLAETLGPTAAARAVAAAAGAVERFAARRPGGGEPFVPLVLRALKQARYEPANAGHSGLAVAAYCHFTSPIRRYPDLTVHRAVCGALGLEPVPSGEGLAALAAAISARERELVDVERRGERVCLAALLDVRRRDEPQERYAGVVVGLIGAGLFVRFADVFEGFVPSRTLGREHFEPSPLGTSLVGAEGRRFRLGDPLEVTVERVDVPAGRVALRAAASSLTDSRRP